MPYQLGPEHIFPPVDRADRDGILAFGGDLDPDRVAAAYREGIFPWPSGRMLLWYAPAKRRVLRPGGANISRSMRKVLTSGRFELRINTAFAEVIKMCSKVPREGQPGTWISPKIRHVYTELHKQGIAHSFETWREGKLVGGLYGLATGKVFSGESMFHTESDASKFAFFEMQRILFERKFDLIDCQVHNEHLASLGAKEMSRNDFVRILTKGQEGEAPTVVD